jgi:hypothetical protein
MKQLAGGKHMENDCFPRTLKFEMYTCIFALLEYQKLLKFIEILTYGKLTYITYSC